MQRIGLATQNAAPEFGSRAIRVSPGIEIPVVMPDVVCRPMVSSFVPPIVQIAPSVPRATGPVRTPGRTGETRITTRRGVISATNDTEYSGTDRSSNVPRCSDAQAVVISSGMNE